MDDGGALLAFGAFLEDYLVRGPCGLAVLSETGFQFSGAEQDDGGVGTVESEHLVGNLVHFLVQPDVVIVLFRVGHIDAEAGTLEPDLYVNAGPVERHIASVRGGAAYVGYPPVCPRDGFRPCREAACEEK